MAQAAPRPLGPGPVGEVDHGFADVSSLLSRRPVAFVALAAVLLFAGVAGALGWRQYRDAQHTALNDARTRAVLAAEIFDVYFGGQLGALSSIAQAPDVKRGDEAGMLAYFKRIQPRNGKLFPGGLSWVNRAGVVRISTLRPAPGDIAHVSDRSYFRAAVRTGRPFVSEGLTARLSHKQVFVESVPTRDATGAINGVLTATLQVRPTRGSKATLDLGFGGLAIIDRRKQAIVVGLVRPARLLGPERFAARQGVISDTDGLNGEPGHVLAFAHSAIPAMDGHPRPLAQRGVRRGAANALPRVGAARRRRAARSRAARLDLHAGAIRGPGRARARAAPDAALPAGARGRRHPSAEPPGRRSSDRGRRLGGALPGRKHGPRGRRRLVRRAAATRRHRPGHGRGRGGPGRLGRGAHGPAAQRLPRLRLRAHVAAGDSQPDAPPHRRRRHGDRGLHRDRSGRGRDLVRICGPPAGAPPRRRIRQHRAARRCPGATARRDRPRARARGPAPASAPTRRSSPTPTA